MEAAYWVIKTEARCIVNIEIVLAVDKGSNRQDVRARRHE